MHSTTKIRVTNAPTLFFARILFFSSTPAFVTTDRLKNCHTSDTFSMVGIRLGNDWTFHCLTKKKKK